MSILNDAAKTENIVALCDVDAKRGGPNLERYSKAAKYEDFRVMLDKEGKNIDACTIGIPDFMHATVALACMQRGKHVYVEKPLTRTPWEARLLQDAAVKYKVATQMGNQGFSHECNRVAAEIVWSGEIGDVTEVHISTTPGTHPTGLQELPPEESVPATSELGSLARRRADAAVQFLVRSLQLARLLRFRHRPDRQLGDACRRSGADRASTRRAGRVWSVRQWWARARLPFPTRADNPAGLPSPGEMPPVKVFYHDSSRAGTPEAYDVPGMENETILPPANNLAEKGRPTGGPALRAGRLRNSRAVQPRPDGGRGSGSRVFGDRGGPPQPGVLTGNGAVFIGTKGIMATRERGEGVWLLPRPDGRNMCCLRSC